MGGRRATPSLIFSILLITVGTLFFLDNINVIRIREVWRFWPIALVVSGISKLYLREGLSGWIWGTFLILCGGLWLGNNLEFFHVTFGTIWPLTLITLGVMMLAKGLETQGIRTGTSLNWPDGSVREYVIFSGSKKKLETPNFEGAELLCVFGGVDLNLRKCGINTPNRQAVIDVAITFGGIEIKIPEGWRVVNRCLAVFGACEDKTLVPRPESGVQPPTLVITGHAFFGAVVIEN
jgi:TM2 domain-containing membrane protein YozV